MNNVECFFLSMEFHYIMMHVLNEMKNFFFFTVADSYISLETKQKKN